MTTKNGKPVMHIAGHSDDIAKVRAAIPEYKKMVAEAREIMTQYNFKDDRPELIASDQATVDAEEDWIPRNKWMNRLTGAFPWNVEPPINLMAEHGMITPNTLFFVRSHGIVPTLSFFDHSITIEGLVNKPLTISMQELVKLPWETIMATINCAGNRRKEQNLIKKTIGFDWGPSGVCNAVWTGVTIHELIKHCGGLKDEAEYINFFGPVGEVQNGDRTYGASHYRDHMMDPDRATMLCFMMNGELLHPDHGYPVRLLIPGYIGGRMIKWVEKITVTKEEDTNWYHVYDNRVFPKHIVSRDVATQEGIWMDPAYRIDDRNLQSVIWEPTHCQKVPYSQKTQKFSGYAYSGWGTKPNRCEVTLNGGVSWRVAKIVTVEPYRRHRKGFAACWVLWEIEIPVEELRKTGEVALRSWCGQDVQPRDHTWTLMGMMNNPWFRVKVKDVPGEAALWFEHPTRVELSYGDGNRQYNKDKLYVLPDGTFPSKGWWEERKAEVVEECAPKEVEVYKKDEGWEKYTRKAMEKAGGYEAAKKTFQNIKASLGELSPKFGRTSTWSEPASPAKPPPAPSSSTGTFTKVVVALSLTGIASAAVAKALVK
jgi:nitrate reductase (NAD(P)H)